MTSRILLLLTLAACTGGQDTGPVDEPDDTATPAEPATPVVTVRAETVFLGIGESTTLTASTVNGEDAGYTWESTDPAVLAVDDGVVTGKSQGEAFVVVTGATTGATAELGLYVSNEIPNLDAWHTSGHADLGSEAFAHWDEDGAVPASCARCHSTTGYRDYLGDDGSAPHAVDADAPTGEGVQCMACHNATASSLEHVTFPSGVALDGLGSEAICMTCHQGRASKDTVDAALTAAEATEPDTVDTDLGFTNVHYAFAGATLNAGVVRGGYQYDDVHGATPSYDVRFRHVEGYQTCTGCHDAHTLEVRVDQCSSCHEGVTEAADLRDVRMMASASVDFDGDGNVEEGLHHEVVGVRDTLYETIQAYAAAKAQPLCWTADAYPYFFVDTDESGGLCDASEATYANGFKSWTPRLLRAAYNFQFAKKDTGAYAHNGKYVIQLMHDSIADLNGALDAPVAFAGDRDDPGHFDGASRAFRNWDGGAVPASCSRCHGGEEGYLFHVATGQQAAVHEPSNGLACSTCHPTEFFSDPSSAAVIDVPHVDFPGGTTLAAADLHASSDAMCATCHSGRESKATIDAYLASTSTPSFRNVHYLPAAAMRYGHEAGVGYEYDGKTYEGARGHMPNDANSQCTFCHAPAETQHTFRVEDRFSLCTNCHSDATSVEDIRWFGNTVDYDGDGDATERLKDELAPYEAAVLDAMRAYATANELDAPCYSASSYPYWFVGAAAECTPAEATYANQYRGWDATLVKAAHNYQFVHKDPGAWAHNIEYAMQLLYDSVESLGADPTPLTRP